MYFSKWTLNIIGRTSDEQKGQEWVNCMYQGNNVYNSNDVNIGAPYPRDHIDLPLEEEDRYAAERAIANQSSRTMIPPTPVHRRDATLHIQDENKLFIGKLPRIKEPSDNPQLWSKLSFT